MSKQVEKKRLQVWFVVPVAIPGQSENRPMMTSAIVDGDFHHISAEDIETTTHGVRIGGTLVPWSNVRQVGTP